MKVYREAYLEQNNLTNEEVIEKFKEFTREKMPDWNFREEQSQRLTRDLGFPSCIIYFHDKQIERNIAINYNNKNKKYYVGNIFPLDAVRQENSCAKVLEYNHYCQRFIKDFRSFCKKNKISISVKFSQEDIKLDKIISGAKVRKYFEAYLSQYPTSYHPCDIERLDRFICAFSRYSKKDIDLFLLQRYLIEDLNWRLEDAEWCFNRIEDGLEILKINKSFY